MSREIKFRTWDENNKEMREDVDDLGAIRSYGWPIMQYTGLKDKNGKEIYEGDIVKTSASPHGHIVEFKYNTGARCGWNLNVPWPDTNHLEVIGNIFETPSLLKDQSN